MALQCHLPRSDLGLRQTLSLNAGVAWRQNLPDLGSVFGDKGANLMATNDVSIGLLLSLK